MPRRSSQPKSALPFTDASKHSMDHANWLQEEKKIVISSTMVLLTICPVVLGGGKSVFDGGGEKIRLKLLSSRILKAGVIATRYELVK